MSLDMSTASFRNSKLYSLQGGNNGSGLSAQLYGSDKHNLMYMTESLNGPSYDSNFFMDSPPSEELIYPSNSTPNPFDSSFLGLRHEENAYDMEYLISQSTDGVGYDEGKMRLKLRELEHALLDDDEDDEVEVEVELGPEHSMELDEDWAGPLRKMMLHDSPKESTSSESSNLSTISSTPRQLLFDCAAMISQGSFEEASVIINELRQMVSIQGDPSQRIAAYMVEGLAARLASSGKVLYKALKCKEPPSFERLAAMQVLFEVCPCFKFGFMAANEAIIEAVKNDKTVHIIDFDVNQGNQYFDLIRLLAKQRGKSIHLRLTGVDDPESVQRSVGGLNNIGRRLGALSEVVGLPFEFRAVPARTPVVTPDMLQCRPEEALVVNFAFQLHHMPDESVSTINERDQLLRMVKSLNPKLVTIVEQDVNTNTTPFLSRFSEAYTYYSAVFESLDATLPRESQDRVNVEKQCLARDIVNIVACEGEERIERYEVAGKWRARMLMAGFRPCRMSQKVGEGIRELIVKQYCNKYEVKEEMGALNFGWVDKNLVVASAWT